MAVSTNCSTSASPVGGMIMFKSSVTVAPGTAVMYVGVALIVGGGTVGVLLMFLANCVAKKVVADAWTCSTRFVRSMVGTNVSVAVGVSDGVAVCDGVAVHDGLGDGVTVGVNVSVGTNGNSVGVGGGVSVLVAVVVAVSVGVKLGVIVNVEDGVTVSVAV